MDNTLKKYLITSGSFVLDDGSIAGPGNTIELPDDVAEANKHQLQLVKEQQAADTSATGE